MGSRKIDVLDLMILKLMVIYEQDIFVIFTMEDLSYMEQNIKDGFTLSKNDYATLTNRNFMDFAWVDNSLEGFLTFLSRKYSNDWSIDAMKHVSLLLATRSINLEKSFHAIENNDSDYSSTLEEILLKDFPSKVLF